MSLALAGAGASLHAQASNASSQDNPFFGSVTVLPASDQTLKLSLDDAVRRGLQNNLGLKEAENDETTLRGQKNEALQEFLPTVTLTGETGVHQQNLVAMGFGPSVIQLFASMFPGGVVPAGFSYITRDDLTQGKIHFDQTLFSGPVISGWKAAGAAEKAAHYAKMSAREEVVQQVASAYLHSIAAQSEVSDAGLWKRPTRCWPTSRTPNTRPGRWRISTSCGLAFSFRRSSRLCWLPKTAWTRI